MAVVVQSSFGFVLDESSFIVRGYERCFSFTETETSHITCSFKKKCFSIRQSHLSRSVSKSADGVPKKTEKASKKRKRKHTELNQGEIDSQAFHEKIRSFVLEGTQSLVGLAKSSGFLRGQSETMIEALPPGECRLAGLCEMAKELPLVEAEEQGQRAQILVTEDGFTSEVDLFSRMTENDQDFAAVVSLMGDEYIIPPRTSFLLSDFTRTHPLVCCGKRFNLIVMDPPWENKSVKRSCRYNSLPPSQLKRLPIPQLASSNCLVVTWVTNRPSHRRFIRDELYPHWGVEVVAEWLWVKVTTCGEFVFPLDSEHKKPYETLVLGRYRPDISTSSSEIPEVSVEEKRLIVSVPSALHSQKPSLSEVLKPYVGPEAKCLELFARNLQPGWTSWGNEVLKFQHTSYFNVSPEDEAKAERVFKP